jgi:hypothetical protein
MPLTSRSLPAGYILPICMIHGILVTKSYVGESSEVAGWGIYDIGTTGSRINNTTL